MHWFRLLAIAMLPASVLAQTAPVISNVTDKSSLESTATTAIAFTVGDGETPAVDLAVRAESSDTILVPNANIVLGGTGTNQTVTITPAAGLSGTTTITLTVTDSDLMTATDTFLLTVNPLYQLPAETIPDIVMQADGTLTINYQMGDGSWTPSVARTNTALFRSVGTGSTNDLRLGGAGANRTLRLRPAPGLYGGSDLTITITGAPGGATSSTFHVTVTPRAVADNLLGVANRISTFDVIRNDTQPQSGTVITLQDFTQPAHGALVAGTIPGTLRYTPEPGFSGNDSFTYTSSYDTGASATATGYVTVAPYLAVDAAHLDLRMNYVNGFWSNEMHTDLPFGTPNAGGSQNPTILDFDEVLMMANPASIITLPTTLDPALYSFLGTPPGASLWNLPQVSKAGVLWPGISTESIAAGTFANYAPTGDARATANAAWVRFELRGYRIPANAVFSMYQSGTTPTVFWDSIDGINGTAETTHGANVSDTFWINTNPQTHAHTNWTFTHPGHYEIDFQTKAFVNEGGNLVEIASPVNTLHFMVYGNGDSTAPGPLAETPPTLADDTAVCTENAGPVTIAVLANDHSGPDFLEALTVTDVTHGSHGTTGLSPDGQAVRYTPAPNFSGLDSFTYTATDEHGGQATATVTVAVHALPIRLLPNGQVRAAALGTPGGTYQFQRSADLSAWQPLGAPVMADAAGNVIIIDPAPLPAKAFYRAFPNS
jgi:surface-anchored protein